MARDRRNDDDEFDRYFSDDRDYRNERDDEHRRTDRDQPDDQHNREERHERGDRYDGEDRYEVRPRRPRRRTSGPGPLDGFFAKTNVAVLILFALCCGGIALPLALIAVLTAKDTTAKSNAGMVLIIIAATNVLSFVAFFFV